MTISYLTPAIFDSILASSKSISHAGKPSILLEHKGHDLLVDRAAGAAECWLAVNGRIPAAASLLMLEYILKIALRISGGKSMKDFVWMALKSLSSVSRLTDSNSYNALIAYEFISRALTSPGFVVVSSSKSLKSKRCDYRT